MCLKVFGRDVSVNMGGCHKEQGDDIDIWKWEISLSIWEGVIDDGVIERDDIDIWRRIDMSCQ